MANRPSLPPGLTVFERGWLSSNNILICGKQSCALIDSGYATHAEQTVALVDSALADRSLDLLVNTHLHSDHCGGNAALQEKYPVLQTVIPPGLSEYVRNWDPVALTFEPTGQLCPQFGFNAVLVPGSEMALGDLHWEVHAAPGHDSHSVILFEPRSRTLISADALWEVGFGVVFPELEGDAAFHEVAQTIDLIESLSPQIVIPGHGSPFSDVAKSIDTARKRLDGFMVAPDRHIRYAAKVLVKFKLLEFQNIELSALIAWATSTPYFVTIYKQNFAEVDFPAWIEYLVTELIKSGAASRDGTLIHNI